MDPFFFEIHKDLPREGPGGDVHTWRALAAIRAELPDKPVVLDIGCGPGRQTIALAHYLPGAAVHAIDTHQPYLDKLSGVLTRHGLANRVYLSNESMDALPFAPGKFDLIWAEGSLYIMGYRKAARYLHDFLAAEGFLVFTELSWIKADPPRELVAYWKEEQEVTVHAAGENAAWLDAHGYDVVETFTLPPDAWQLEYYTPLATRLELLRLRHAGDAAKQALLETELRELAIFEKWHDFYGYVFYICRKMELPER